MKSTGLGTYRTKLYRPKFASGLSFPEVFLVTVLTILLLGTLFYVVSHGRRSSVEDQRQQMIAFESGRLVTALTRILRSSIAVEASDTIRLTALIPDADNVPQQRHFRLVTQDNLVIIESHVGSSTFDFSPWVVSGERVFCRLDIATTSIQAATSTLPRARLQIIRQDKHGATFTRHEEAIEMPNLLMPTR